MNSIAEESSETLTFVDVLRIEVAAMQAKYPERMGAIARAHAAIIEGHVVALEDGSGKVLSDDQHTWYVTNGTCSCAAGDFQKPCKHLSAWRLYTRVAEKYAEHQRKGQEDGDMITPPWTAPTPMQGAVAEDHKVPKEYLELVHGRPFVLYKGLLALAHEAGLVELHAEFLSVTAELATAKAEAVFGDGRRFGECADATPSNVGPTVQAHFARVALTRAKARTLRDALNVGMCSLEELGDISEAALPDAEPDGWCPKHQCAMKLNHGKDGSTWLSHRLPTGEWCKGK